MRLRSETERERLALLDHGVSFACEDAWRNPYSADPLAPKYRGKPYPYGKQLSAHMSASTGSEWWFAYDLLEALQREAARRSQEQYAKAREVAARRVRAAQKPLVTIEPTTSVPGVQQTIRELEKRCRLPIEEIRWRRHEPFVEDAIRALVKHHRMVHPVFDNPELGFKQWTQARATWREFVGQSKVAQNNREIAFWAFGEKWGDDGEQVPEDYDFDDRDPTHVARLRAPRTKKKPQIVPRVAEALDVSKRTVERILSHGSVISTRGQFPSRPEQR